MKNMNTLKETMKHMDFHIAIAKTLASNWIGMLRHTSVYVPTWNWTHVPLRSKLQQKCVHYRRNCKNICNHSCGILIYVHICYLKIHTPSLAWLCQFSPMENHENQFMIIWKFFMIAHVYIDILLTMWSMHVLILYPNVSLWFLLTTWIH